MENQSAMNKYKGKVDNISFDVAKGARDRYKAIAKESGMKLGEFIIHAMEDYIRLHDLDTVDTLAIKPSSSDNLIWNQDYMCYIPVTTDTKARLDDGTTKEIRISENNVTISGVDWSTIQYQEVSSNKELSEAETIGHPIPMFNNDPSLLIETSTNANKSYLYSWASLLKSMFTINSETKRINYKLDHQPYKIVRNLSNTQLSTEMSATNKTQTTVSGDTQVLSEIPNPFGFNDIKDDAPLTKKDLSLTLPSIIEAVVKKYINELQK